MNGTSPTRVRFAVVAVTALASVLLYLDRVCISFTEVYVREYLGIGPEQMSWVLGAFFFSYALAQVPSGWLSDRFGARRMLTIYILGWSLFTAATGLATGLLTLLAARLAFGIAQAGAYPTAAGLVGRWFPLQGRGKANSIVALGGRVGGAAAPLLTALLLVSFTPVSTPSQFVADDLINLKQLGQQLQRDTDDGAGRLAQRIRERLPPSKPETVVELAALDPTATVSPALQARILEDLNHVLAESNLTANLDLKGLSLSREAIRLSDISPDLRTPNETERLNRLMIEMACPGSVRQIYGRTWREVLLTYGCIGLLVAAAFWFIVRDQPKQHPWTNEAEVKLAGDSHTSSSPSAKTIPWGLLITSRNMWLSGLTQFGVNFGWVFLITLLPRYLTEVFRVPIEERGTMASLPLFVSCVGMFLGGALTDRLAPAIGLRWGRALPIGLAQFVCATMFVVCLYLPSAWAVVIALCVMAVAVDLSVPSIWSFAQDIGGRNVGATVGWGNMWGNLGAGLSPVVLTRVQTLGGWSSVFVCCSAAFVVAGFAGLMLDAAKPLEPKDSISDLPKAPSAG